MTDTIDALFAAVRATPAEDLPRELYAEALEQYDQENPATVKCWKCGGSCMTNVIGKDGRRLGSGVSTRKGPTRGGWPIEDCPECHAVGSVPDTRLADRVAFIRAGVELARLLDGWKPETWDCLDMYLDPQDKDDQRWKHKVWDVRTRHDALLSRHRLEWLGGEKCPKCADGVCRGKFPDGSPTGPLPCHACRGTGWACWPLVEDNVRHLPSGEPIRGCVRSLFSRGWVHKVELTWEQLFAPGAAAAIWRHHPVTECVVTDAVIHPSGGYDFYFLASLGRFPSKYWGQRLDRHYTTPEAARKAMSDVACEWGREQAAVRV